MSSNFDTILQEEQKAERAIAEAKDVAQNIVIAVEKKRLEKEVGGKKDADKSLANKVRAVEKDIEEKKVQFLKGIEKQIAQLESGREELVKKCLEVLKKKFLV